jgi:hypothetical protein
VKCDAPCRPAPILLRNSSCNLLLDDARRDQRHEAGMALVLQDPEGDLSWRAMGRDWQHIAVINAETVEERLFLRPFVGLDESHRRLRERDKLIDLELEIQAAAFAPRDFQLEHVVVEHRFGVPALGDIHKTWFGQVSSGMEAQKIDANNQQGAGIQKGKPFRLDLGENFGGFPDR